MVPVLILVFNGITGLVCVVVISLAEMMDGITMERQVDGRISGWCTMYGRSGI